MIKAKGLKKSLIKKELTHKIFEDCILEGKDDQPRTAQFLRSYRHRMYRIKQTKRSINPRDKKLWIGQDETTPYLFGDFLANKIHTISTNSVGLIKLGTKKPKSQDGYARIIQNAWRRFRERVPSNAKLAWNSLPNDGTSEDKKFLV
ncbi:hypothetical protein Glove_346g89 [Diversispora epigaea]|uniref:Uncharacterized protein n=1 Tax=Diversispora epigaea TaxID=1348612 RepID=A0A397HFD1_9GLOM|nr:hypothetical protein Glove_346g89 [Diversispora epigaea]